MKQYLGMLGLLMVTVIWGGGFPASDIALESASPFQILAVRFTIATIFMALIAFKELKSITKEEMKCGVLLGTSLFAGFALQIVGLQYTTVSNNAFLTATNVVFVPIIAFIIRRKRIELRNLVGVLMAIIGAGILSLSRHLTIGFGDLLTLFCAVAFAFQIFLTGEYVGKIRPAVLNFLQMVTAAVFSLIGCLFSGEVVFEPTGKSFAAILYLGIASTTITYLLQTVSQKYVEETKAAIILSMEAVFGTIFSIILLHEPVTLKMVIGSSLILGAVLVSEIKLKK